LGTNNIIKIKIYWLFFCSGCNLPLFCF